jgi:hypothetical protein
MRPLVRHELSLLVLAGTFLSLSLAGCSGVPETPPKTGRQEPFHRSPFAAGLNGVEPVVLRS